jgi:hypothetical protein
VPRSKREREQAEREDKRIRQRLWREETAPQCITAHLEALDAATLDAIAIELYEQNPHDPREGVFCEPQIYPGRPEAIRELCRRWRQQNGDPKSLQKLRDPLALFYRHEASWRRVENPETDVTPPHPPWRPKRRKLTL